MLKENGQVVHRSTIRPLTPDELLSPDEIKARVAFDEPVPTALGAAFKPGDLPSGDSDDTETPTNDLYADEDDGENQHALEARQMCY